MVRHALAIALFLASAPAQGHTDKARLHHTHKPAKPPQRPSKPPKTKHYFYHEPDCPCRCHRHDREDDDDDHYDSAEDYD